MITTVAKNNQTTIPLKLAQQLNIQPGAKLDWSIGQDGELIVRLLPNRSELARQIAGMGRSWLPANADPVAALIHEREADTQN